MFNFSENECRGKPFAFNLVDEHGYQTINREGLLLVHTLKSIEVYLVTKFSILLFYIDWKIKGGV